MSEKIRRELDPPIFLSHVKQRPFPLTNLQLQVIYLSLCLSLTESDIQSFRHTDANDNSPSSWLAHLSREIRRNNEPYNLKEAHYIYHPKNEIPAAGIQQALPCALHPILDDHY